MDGFRVREFASINTTPPGTFEERSRDLQEPVGFARVPETVQVIRAEFLQEMLRAGIELHEGEGENHQMGLKKSRC